MHGGCIERIHETIELNRLQYFVSWRGSWKKQAKAEKTAPEWTDHKLNYSHDILKPLNEYFDSSVGKCHHNRMYPAPDLPSET